VAELPRVEGADAARREPEIGAGARGQIAEGGGEIVVRHAQPARRQRDTVVLPRQPDERAVAVAADVGDDAAHVGLDARARRRAPGFEAVEPGPCARRARAQHDVLGEAHTVAPASRTTLAPSAPSFSSMRS